ncbi:MAG: hypothetical protein WC821_03390 [archaeon]|jgi:hypothetical protein
MRPRLNAKDPLQKLLVKTKAGTPLANATRKSFMEWRARMLIDAAKAKKIKRAKALKKIAIAKKARN